MSDPLPTDSQRLGLCYLIHAAFVEIREFGWTGKASQAGDLADAFHNLSMEIWGIGGWEWEHFREDLQRYQNKYPECYIGKRDYVQMFHQIRAGKHVWARQ